MNAPRPAHRYCHACGVAYADVVSWPRTCTACGRVTYQNPTPVAVLVVPVVDGDAGHAGVLLVRRGNVAGSGQLALPGGFVDMGESYAAAAARELREEAGVDVDVDGITLLQVETAGPRGDVLLVFCQAQPVQASTLPPFVPTPEITERRVVQAPVALAFPSHTAVLAAFFERRTP